MGGFAPWNRPPLKTSSIIQQDGHLLLLCKPHSLPKHGEGELGQGLGIVLGMFRNVRFAVLPVRAYGAIRWVAFGFGPAEDGDLIGPPRQLVQFLQYQLWFGRQWARAPGT